MRAWWWRSVAACASLAAVAGVVATVAVAADADRTDHEATLTAERSHQVDRARPADQDQPPPSRTAAEQRAPAVTDRVGDPGLGVSVAPPPGWRQVPGQRLIPVPAGRLPLVLAPDDRAAVLVGGLDPARAGTPVDPARTESEARRLVGAFADGTNPDGSVTTVSDAADTVDGRRAWTSVRRTEGGPRDLAGTMVRVTAVEGAPRGVVAVAVVRPGPGQAAAARAADALVRSLDLGSGGPGGRPAEAPRPVPAVAPRTAPQQAAPRTAPRALTPRPGAPRPAPPSPAPPSPASPAPASPAPASPAPAPSGRTRPAGP